jgi:uncharacterized ferritin-like protein (DUF455 family)
MTPPLSSLPTSLAEAACVVLRSPDPAAKVALSRRFAAAGVRWFRFLCDRRGIDPEATFHTLTRRNFKGRLKPPFNTEARMHAGFGEEFYRPLSA